MKDTMNEWNENNFKRWDSGGKLIFIATVIAFLSLFMKWADMGIISVTGFQQQGYIFLAFYIYPMVKLLKDEPINKKIGLISGAAAVIGGVLFVFSKTVDVFGESANFAATGLYVYIISAITLVVGIVKRENISEITKE